MSKYILIIPVLAVVITINCKTISWFFPMALSQGGIGSPSIMLVGCKCLTGTNQSSSSGGLISDPVDCPESFFAIKVPMSSHGSTPAFTASFSFLVLSTANAAQ